jgi:hypothetical protein
MLSSATIFNYAVIERISFTCYIGDLLGPRTGLDVMEKRKISFTCRESNSDFSVAQLVA